VTPPLPCIAELRARVEEAGYGSDVAWAENLKPPTDPLAFAAEVIFVICNSGMRFTVARGIFDRVMAALERGESADAAFGHKGKAAAIDRVWADREQLYAEFFAAPDKVGYCETLPWIGGITKYHLAKNFGVDVAKPDVHLQRLAETYETSAQVLCERIAAISGLRVATVDTLLWRAAALGILDTATGRILPRRPLDPPSDLFGVVP
jgi:hypothetical protein